MTLETIRHAVLAEAESEAKRIMDGAQRNAAQFLESHKASLEQEFDRICQNKKQVIEEEYGRKLIQFKGTAGKEILDKRNKILKELFVKAKNEILSWPPEKYAAAMKRLIATAAGDEEGRIRVHPQDKDVFAKALAELNQGRGGAGIAMDADAPLAQRGGFIFVSEDFEVDRTLDKILGEIEQEMLPDIAAALFAG